MNEQLAMAISALIIAACTGLAAMTRASRQTVEELRRQNVWQQKAIERLQSQIDQCEARHARCEALAVGLQRRIAELELRIQGPNHHKES